MQQHKVTESLSGRPTFVPNSSEDDQSSTSKTDTDDKDDEEDK